MGAVLKRVVIVDDAIVVHFILKQILTSEGYEVVGVAEEGTGVLDLVKSTRPDVVLLDLGIPGKDGMQLLTEIKSQVRCVKVIICTSVRLTHVVEEATRLGADGYLMKPIVPDELRMNLKRIEAQLAS